MLLAEHENGTALLLQCPPISFQILVDEFYAICFATFIFIQSHSLYELLLVLRALSECISAAVFMDVSTLLDQTSYSELDSLVSNTTNFACYPHSHSYIVIRYPFRAINCLHALNKLSIRGVR